MTTIEQIQYTGRNCGEVHSFMYPDDDVSWPDPCNCDGNEDWYVSTPDGPVWARPGDVIVKHDSDDWDGFSFTVQENS